MQTGFPAQAMQSTPISDVSPVAQSFNELETSLSELEGAIKMLINRLSPVSVALPEKPVQPDNKLSRQPCSISDRIAASNRRTHELVVLVAKTVDELHI